MMPLMRCKHSRWVSHRLRRLFIGTAGLGRRCRVQPAVLGRQPAAACDDRSRPPVQVGLGRSPAAIVHCCRLEPSLVGISQQGKTAVGLWAGGSAGFRGWCQTSRGTEYVMLRWLVCDRLWISTAQARIYLQAGSAKERDVITLIVRSLAAMRQRCKKNKKFSIFG